MTRRQELEKLSKIFKHFDTSPKQHKVFDDVTKLDDWEGKTQLHDFMVNELDDSMMGKKIAESDYVRWKIRG